MEGGEQVKILDFGIAKAIAALAGETLPGVQTATGPVSYTHLDVYKRQAYTWDYFKNVHGRNGIANDGKGSYNRVHYGRAYNNAFWSDSCFCMTYGDGDGRSFSTLVSLDVAGHEMTHGITARLSLIHI